MRVGFTFSVTVSAAESAPDGDVPTLPEWAFLLTALLLLTVIGLLCGVFQILLGVIGLGRLIKYMPYPVVSGYLSGVGFYIIASQVPKLLGWPKGTLPLQGLTDPSLWQTLQLVPA